MEAVDSGILLPGGANSCYRGAIDKIGWLWIAEEQLAMTYTWGLDWRLHMNSSVGHQLEVPKKLEWILVKGKMDLRF